MNPANIEFLEANRGMYDLFIRAGIIKHMDGYTRERMVLIMREEFDPSYIGSTWCSDCVANTMKLLYTLYDAWKEKQKNILPSD